MRKSYEQIMDESNIRIRAREIREEQEKLSRQQAKSKVRLGFWESLVRFFGGAGGPVQQFQPARRYTARQKRRRARKAVAKASRRVNRRRKS